MFRILLVLLVGGVSLCSYAKHRVNLGLGAGDVSQKYSTTEYDLSSLGGYLEGHYDWNNILIGINFAKISKSNTNNGVFNDQDVWVGGAYLGFNFWDRLELIAGYGGGRSKRTTTIPYQFDQHDGVGTFVGARVYLIDTEYVEVGLMAHHFMLSADEYLNSTGGGAETTYPLSSESTGTMYGLVVSFKNFKISK